MNISGISGSNFFGSSSSAVGSSLSVNANNSNATVSNSQLGGPFASLNLTSAQQQKIAQIFQNAQNQGLSPQQVQTQINAVLTPAQQQQLQSQMSQMSQHHHHHHQGSSSTSNSQNGQSDTDAYGIPTQTASGSSTGTQTIGDIAASFWIQTQQQSNT